LHGASLIGAIPIFSTNPTKAQLMMTCNFCGKEYSSGIGQCCSRSCHTRFLNSQRNYKDQYAIKQQLKFQVYEANPSYCMQCNHPLTWNQRRNKFCSTNCAAIVSNALRTNESRSQQSITLKQTLKNKGLGKEKPSEYHYECLNCKQRFTCLRNEKKFKYCSKECKKQKAKTGIRLYRRECKFKFTENDWPELFNQELIERYGWYSPKNSSKPNLTGVCWDHLFRIEDGFRLGIDPEIMRHPANAELVTWPENIRRRRSQISFDELLKRIDNFGKKC
jgi:hypothetical protein